MPHEKYFIPQHYRLKPAYQNIDIVEAIYDCLYFRSILMTWAHHVKCTLGRH